MSAYLDFFKVGAEGGGISAFFHLSLETLVDEFLLSRLDVLARSFRLGFGLASVSSLSNLMDKKVSRLWSKISEIKWNLCVFVISLFNQLYEHCEKDQMFCY